MAQNLVDRRHLATLLLDLEVAWHWGSALPSADPDAKPFSPPFVDPKPVMYVPVKKRGGKETFPTLLLNVDLFERGTRRLNFRVPDLRGAEVRVTVRNIYHTWDKGPQTTELTGKLDDDLRCSIAIDADKVKSWLDPAGPLGASVNENLIDALVEIPGVRLGGQPAKAESVNRVFLYRRKAIAFLPGVFGSSFQVKTSDGNVDAFPNFLSSSFLPASQEIGRLECDSDGKALLQAYKPALLRLLGVVYDTYDVLRAARKETLRLPPEDFRLYEMNLFAYDWRGDLTDAAKAMMDRLRTLRDQLRRLPDTDDQIAVAGHSTGGVIIRRMLGLPDAEEAISHAFFLNVPFRGAPKALGVMLTGADPPGGGSMIPFIKARSLANIGLAAPIVYHLAPSYRYPRKVASFPSDGSPPLSPEPREAEKAGLVEAAIRVGVYPRRRVVDASRATDQATRQKLALGADEFADYHEELFAWKQANEVYRAVWTNGGIPYFGWPERELAERGLAHQQDARIELGWNTTLGGRANAFHKASEAAAAGGRWADKAFVFWSKGHKTTGHVMLDHAGDRICDGIVDLYSKSSTTHEFTAGEARPPKGPDGDWMVWTTWHAVGGRYVERTWRLMAGNVDGDGTVPLVSLLGFGGPAKVFQEIPGSPEHVPAPNSVWLWKRILDVLQGRDVTKHLLSTADPVAGTE